MKEMLDVEMETPQVHQTSITQNGGAMSSPGPTNMRTRYKGRKVVRTEDELPRRNGRQQN